MRLTKVTHTRTYTVTDIDDLPLYGIENHPVAFVRKLVATVEDKYDESERKRKVEFSIRGYGVPATATHTPDGRMGLRAIRLWENPKEGLALLYDVGSLVNDVEMMEYAKRNLGFKGVEE